jgi:transposase
VSGCRKCGSDSLLVQDDLGGIVIGERRPRHDESPGHLVTFAIPERDHGRTRNSRWLVTIFGGERACCPLCGVQSRSRHSVYPRTLDDLSAQGTAVTIQVRVGRWRCRNERCDRQVFAERLPGLAAPSARQTDRLADLTLTSNQRVANKHLVAHKGQNMPVELQH